MQNFVRLRSVIERTGLSRSTIYNLMAAGQFPKPVKISVRCVAWPEEALQLWINEKLEGAA